MKIKNGEIKPGMVIHCPKEEDARALLEHLDDEEYVWTQEFPILPKTDKIVTNYIAVEFGKSIGFVFEADLGEKTIITEFSDLIELDDVGESVKNLANAAYKGVKETMDGIYHSKFFDGNDDFNDWNYEPDKKPTTEMSAMEVLEWLLKYRGKTEFKECFGQLYAMDILFNQFTADKIIDKITTYEATKKEPKPVKVEYGKLLYVSVRNPDTGLYQNYSKLEYWPDKQIESYETVKTTFLSEAARETQKTVRINEYDICRVKEGLHE